MEGRGVVMGEEVARIWGRRRGARSTMGEEGNRWWEGEGESGECELGFWAFTRYVYTCVGRSIIVAWGLYPLPLP